MTSILDVSGGPVYASERVHQCPRRFPRIFFLTFVNVLAFDFVQFTIRVVIIFYFKTFSTSFYYHKRSHSIKLYQLDSWKSILLKNARIALVSTRAFSLKPLKAKRQGLINKTQKIDIIYGRVAKRIF